MNDRQFAARLQAQFDKEAVDFEKRRHDAAIARTIAKAHSVSDSESSDSDTGNLPWRDNDGSDGLFAKKKAEKRKYQETLDHGEQSSTKNKDRQVGGTSSGKRIRKDRCNEKKNSLDVYEEFQDHSFFLTKVKGLASQHNITGAMSLKDILARCMGQLKESCHFNYMFDVPWLMKQYPEEYRNLPVLLVHGEQGRSELDLKAQANSFTNITFCRAQLDIPYGTHHTKMMFLLYGSGLRIVVHTANLIQNDWHQKTQGIWISPVFPRLSNPNDKGESPTNFKADLLRYVAAYRSAKLLPWEQHIKAHDFSKAKVHIIGSVPGRHTLGNKQFWGHLKLKKVLSERGPEDAVKSWPLAGQFSSIGSLGPTPDAWLLTEFGQSLNTCRKTMPSNVSKSKFHLIFPSKDNIRLSLEGYNGGGCVPYSIKTASKQSWLTPFFSQWKSEGRGRSRAVPHIKSYTRFHPDGSQAAWFLVTSANLSKAAWGALEKQGSQLMIRSYELGVLFLPQEYGSMKTFTLSTDPERVADSQGAIFPLPYDLPPSTYAKGDRPWFCDVPCMDMPDTFGTMWCPPL